MCLVQYSKFKKHGKLLSHEEARQRGDVVVLDVYEHVLSFAKDFATMFVSHQWLGLTAPDPNGDHYRAIIEAADKVCEANGHRNEDFYIWIDYSCIPQRNPTLMKLSIASLGVYSSFARYFVIIAPTCTHFDRGSRCDTTTYKKRGWTRLEQWARMTFVGFENMFIYSGKNLQPVAADQQWYEESIRVVEGDYSVESDKVNQVDPVLGLWCYAIKNKGRDNSGKTAKLYDSVMRYKDKVFPKALFDDLVDLLDEPEVLRSTLAKIKEPPKVLPSLPPDVYRAVRGHQVWS